MDIVGYVFLALIALGVLRRPGLLRRDAARPRRVSPDAADVARVARYLISPERSHVWIDARSNVHPIHSSTSGLEGFVELELGPAGAVDLAVDAGRDSCRWRSTGCRRATGWRTASCRSGSTPGGIPTIDGVARADGAGRRRRPATGSSGEITFRGVSRPHEDVMDIRPVDDRTIRPRRARRASTSGISGCSRPRS